MANDNGIKSSDEAAACDVIMTHTETIEREILWETNVRYFKENKREILWNTNVRYYGKHT